MTKKKKTIIAAVCIVCAIAVTLTAVLLKGKGKTETKPDIPGTESTVSEPDINVSDITSSEDVESTLPDSDNYISPDEAEADKILNSKPQDTSSKPATSKPEPVSNIQALPDEDDAVVVSFEEGKKKLKEAAEKYMREHNIDPKTAGETGELCPNCEKKLWNPDKYGLNIPGMPEDYEHSGYCLGTCGIMLE